MPAGVDMGAEGSVLQYASVVFVNRTLRLCLTALGMFHKPGL